MGKRWATLDPALKATYEGRYQEARKQYDAEMSQYKPQKKKKDPNAPKQPLSAYFIFSTEERLKVSSVYCRIGIEYFTRPFWLIVLWYYWKHFCLIAENYQNFQKWLLIR